MKLSRIRKVGGAQYASGKTLVIFLEGGGEWFPDKVSRQLKEPLLFDSLWLFSLCSPFVGGYVYDVVQFQNGLVNKWKIFINKEFDSWVVKKNY